MNTPYILDKKKTAISQNQFIFRFPRNIKKYDYHRIDYIYKGALYRQY